MIKKHYLWLILISLFIACGGKVEQVTEDTFDDGSPKMVKYYKTDGDNKILVKETGYYPNGQKRIEGEFRNGKRHGKWFYWYENGNTWSEGTFEEGRRNGSSVNYHENGSKYVEGTYEDDIRVKIWRFYDENGVLLKEIDYDKEQNR
ncbi:MAG: hypothetical protein KKA81_05895 [Bacteroidetes bacterium]|nr:hypothetical protein [Bacteroidota bacterium]